MSGRSHGPDRQETKSTTTGGRHGYDTTDTDRTFTDEDDDARETM